MFSDVQIIRQNKIPAFAVIPYSEYLQLKQQAELAARDRDERIKFPLAVVEMHALKGYGLIKAWRIHLGKTQKELAAAMGITQGAFSQIEKNAGNQRETLRKVAAAMGLQTDQLTLDD